MANKNKIEFNKTQKKSRISIGDQFESMNQANLNIKKSKTDFTDNRPVTNNQMSILDGSPLENEFFEDYTSANNPDNINITNL